MKIKPTKKGVIQVSNKANSEKIKLHMQEWHKQNQNKFANANYYREFFWEEYDRIFKIMQPFNSLYDTMKKFVVTIDAYHDTRVMKAVDKLQDEGHEVTNIVRKESMFLWVFGSDVTEITYNKKD